MSTYKGVKTLEVLEGADNYNGWIASMLSPYIKFPALEVGAGTGNLSEFFCKKGKVLLTDNDLSLVELLRKKFINNKNVEVRVLDIAKASHKIDSKFKTVYAVNVLEHIENDDQALHNLWSLLETGGNLVVLVPAKKFAYTKLDKSLGHVRRYEKNELIEKIEKSGFRILKVEYFNIVGLLSWLIRNRITKNHRSLKKSHVKFFDSAVPFLRAIEPTKGLPVGISLIAVGIKK